MNVNLKGMGPHEMESWCVRHGFEAYRGRQIRHWIYKRLAASFEEMSNLPKPFIALLEKKAVVDALEKVKVLVSQDGTQKYLFRLKDGYLIESVLIPERDHFTICVSSQAGCAMGCRFCLTARQGLKRNLTVAEIVDQVIQVKRSIKDPDRLNNIVFMGMGEPLQNYDAVVRAMQDLISEEGMNFSHRKVTLSTCGIVPGIRQMGQDIAVNLAVSLNATDDKTRNFLMPINRKYPLKRLLSVCKKIPLPNRRMITFEYILIKGINDTDQDAERLCGLLSGIRAKINLIPLNPNLDTDLTPTPMQRITHFQKIILDNNVTAIIRKSKGRDIMAACGQLSGEYANKGSKTEFKDER